MNKSRLAKLTALTQGAALVGTLAGAGALPACDRPSGEPVQAPTTSAPTAASADPAAATASATAAPPTGDTAGATGAVPTRHMPIPNAPPRFFRNQDGGADGSP